MKKALRQKRARAQRGWVMITVLMILLVLTLVVSGFYMQAEDSTSINRMNQGQKFAVAHAEQGLQEGVRMVRAAQVSIPLGTCLDAEIAAGTCPPGNFVASPLVNNGNALELAAGGGLQYQFFIYKRTNVGDVGVPTSVNRVVIRSNGFYGYTLNSPNLVTSILEVEMDVGRGNNFQCVNSYECQ